ncbi:hypothetical protein [Phyllobacterium bourgognense]|uniref:non-homologous end-joining DNA ligase LigD n=1 Tax=Phyllobacterium bourgognense TaxID=314236 RepID=UPI0011C06AAE
MTVDGISRACTASPTRARVGAAVSMPLAWDELSPLIGPDDFTVDNAQTRIAAPMVDPWEDFRSTAGLSRARNIPRRKI